MAPSETTDVTQYLKALSLGDPAAMDHIMPIVYQTLRQQAAAYLRREPAGHSIQPTALVHEAFLKLANQQNVDWQGRSHFLAIGAQAMRRILVDHARRKTRAKHGGNRHRITLDDNLAISPQRDTDLLALDDALEKLAKIDPRQAKIVELRFFGGLSVQEVADVLGVSKRTVEADWTMVRAWLRRELSGDEA